MLILGDQKHHDEIRDFRRLAREDEEIHGCGLDLTDDFLSSFLRGKNHDQKKALKTLKQYVHVRKGKYNDFFKTVIPSRCKYFQDLPKFQAFFKNRDAEGHVVGFFKLSMIDFNEVDIEDIFRAFVVACEELIQMEDLVNNGLVAIIDCRGMAFSHVKVFTPSRIQFLFNIFVGTYPVKYKGFHVLYDSFLFDPLLKVFKMFAPRKIRERIFLHGNDENSLRKNFTHSILPDWLGGDLPVEECYDYDFETKAYAREDHYKMLAMKW